MKKDFRDDPAYDFRVGQLVGGTRLVGSLLVEHEDPQVKKMGEQLLERVSWFLTDVPKDDGLGAWAPES